MQSQGASHSQYWTDLLKDLQGVSWTHIISTLFNTNHGFSNYERCKKRNHTQIRQDVFEDEKVKSYVSQSEESAKKAERILDEMCHLLAIQTTPTRKLKWTGSIFMKCITGIYSSIYVNTHLMPMAHGATGPELRSFKEQFLSISSKMPVVILPTHRSYMDFLFITYVMFINELPLPIVAAGDNFKALGTMLTNYLKATGAFLVRRNASNKQDIEAKDYHDILRAYVHSVVGGGENPIEFFMEGTRTRLGQVLRPKTGLLSMIVDMYLDGSVEDICILPVSINYQRPIEEQLYVSEMTPQISKSKPKETAKNLLSALDKIMKRKYGKVYVRFLEPFKLSDYHEQWNQATTMTTDGDVDKSVLLHDLTTSLATKVCLAQANHNVLMPFNLITFSCVESLLEKHYSPDANDTIRESVEKIAEYFIILEDLLKKLRPDFVAGWKGHLDILDEFKLDRDGIIRTTPDRKWVEFERDARTFHTLAYYSNQLMQILLPLGISILLCDGDLAVDKTAENLEHYKSIRSLFAMDFLIDELSQDKEFEDSIEFINTGLVCEKARRMILEHMAYYLESYLTFLTYLKEVEVLVKSEFFEKIDSENKFHYISKDMLNNMINMVKDEGVCRSLPEDDPRLKPSTSKRFDEQLEVQSKEELINLYERFHAIQGLLYSYM